MITNGQKVTMDTAKKVNIAFIFGMKGLSDMTIDRLEYLFTPLA